MITIGFYHQEKKSEYGNNRILRFVRLYIYCPRKIKYLIVMKKIASVCVIALVVLSMSSCKKDWTCTCTLLGTSSSIPINDATKSDAEDACSALEILGNSCELAKN